jgi:phospholipid/cholesterol/gamma-HCH transport system substrate-binding protein
MDTKKQFLLGMFFLAALSILAYYTLFMADFTLFGEKSIMQVDFPEAHDLREGDPVKVLGLTVGRVRTLEWRLDAPPERRVRATLSLEHPVKMLKGGTIWIRESTLLGGRQINIEPGPSGAEPMELPPDQMYLGAVLKNPIDQLAALGELIESNKDSVGNILSNVDAITRDAREIVERAKRGEGGIVGRAIGDEVLAQNIADGIADLRSAAKDLSEAMAQMEQGRGLLGKLVYDEAWSDALVARFDAAATGLQRFADNLETGKGLLAKLVGDETVVHDFDRVVSDVKSTAENLRLASEGLRTGDSLLARLISDPETARRFDEIVENLRHGSAVLARFEDSSLGRLMGDDGQIYRQISDGLALLTRSLEDYREAAPIATFTSVIFSAF